LSRVHVNTLLPGFSVVLAIGRRLGKTCIYVARVNTKLCDIQISVDVSN
jgi:hypothetical protein